MVSMNAKSEHDRWAEGMTAFTYMRYEEVAEWATTHNTVASVGHRGEGYEQFKQQKTEVMLDELEKKFPHLRKHIRATYTSTPLTYRRSEENTSELQSLMRISSAVFCLKTKNLI